MNTSVADLVTPSEAAVRLGVSRERLVRMVQRGALAGHYDRGTNRWYVARASLDKTLLAEGAGV